MPKPTSEAFVLEKNKRIKKPITLYIIENYRGTSEDLYLAFYRQDVVFDGVTYRAFPVVFDSIKENSKGEIDTVSMRVCNIRREIQQYIENYDIRGHKVTIRTVFSNLLDDSTNKIDDVYSIDRWDATKEDVTFTLASKFNVLNIQLPLCSYSRNLCQHAVFKGTECGYTGPETSCSRTKTACKAYNNYSRFGGFPSIAGRRVQAV